MSSPPKRQIPPTPENVRSALSRISPSCDRETWVRVLAAIKDALAEDGRAIADEWSQQGDGYSKTDFRDAWKSVKPGGKVTVATLWRMALDGGWKPDTEACEETAAERLERERKRKARADQEARDRARKEKAAASKASALWKASSAAAFSHPYLERKRVYPVSTLRETTAEQAASILGYTPKSDGEPLAGRLLLIPVKVDGRLTTLEMIDQEGRKSAIYGGPKSGGYWAAQPMPKGDGDGLTLALGEGVATSLTVREAVKWPVFAALSGSNLPKAAQAIHKRCPKARFVVLGDVGGALKYAEQAARAVGGVLAVPAFTSEQVEAFQHQHGKPPTDWNDLHALAGLDAVRDQLGKLLAAGPGTPPEIPEDTGAASGGSPAPAEATQSGDTGGVAESGAKPGTVVPFPGTPKQPPKGKPPTPPGGGNDDDEPARPSYQVREDWSSYGPPGVWFHGHKNTRKGDPEPLNLWLCSPLHVEAVTCTDDGRYFGRFLRFRDTFGRWREWAMPMEMLRGSCEELRGELLAAGVMIDYNERARLADYLQWRIPKRRITAAIRTGWTRDGRAFVLPEQVIGSADVFYQAESMHQDGTAERGGDFETWKSEIAARCVGNPVLGLSLCVALAGPLLAKVHRDSGGVHWVGDSSTGKTTALNVGCSVWGGDTFRRTWRATANGLEAASASLNDTCLCLDEINEADPKEVGSIIYALGNGTGKTRANRVGAARHVFRWRLTLLSTGERTLAAQMAEGGKQPKAGQLIRLLGVPAGRKHGAFDELHGFPEGRALADHLKTVCGRHYGHAGPAFIEAMLRDGRDFGAALADVEALEHFQAANSQEARGASRFALYGLAGELAIEWGILPWPVGEALKAAAEGFRLWKEARGGGSTEDRQILQAVADFISKHGDARFSEKSPDPLEQKQPVVMQRAGWWIDLEDVGRVYLFTSQALREATQSHDFNRVLKALDKAGWIHSHNPGRHTKRTDMGKHTEETDIGQRKLPLYWVLPKDLDE